VTLEQLMLDPRDRERHLDCLPLILERDDDEWLTPEGELQLQDGDQILFCGHEKAQQRMQWVLANCNALVYIREAEERPDSYVWRWFSK
jgi:voltage-gated potassium channel